MCNRITEFDLDEAMETVKSHAPKCAALIDGYITQMKRSIRDDIETLRMAGIDAVGMVTVQHLSGMEPYNHINKIARDVAERIK